MSDVLKTPLLSEKDPAVASNDGDSIAPESTNTASEVKTVEGLRLSAILRGAAGKNGETVPKKRRKKREEYEVAEFSSSQHVELQIETMSTTTTNFLLYSWNGILIIALVLQSIIGLQLEVRNLCDSNKESVTDITQWNSPCALVEQGTTDDVSRLSAWMPWSSFTRASAGVPLDVVGGPWNGNEASGWMSMKELFLPSDLPPSWQPSFPSLPSSGSASLADSTLSPSGFAEGMQVLTSGAMEGMEERQQRLQSATKYGVNSHGLLQHEYFADDSTDSSSSSGEGNETLYDVRWAGAMFSGVDRKLNRFAKVVLSMDSPYRYGNISDSLWVFYQLRISLVEIVIDHNDSSSSSSSSSSSYNGSSSSGENSSSDDEENVRVDWMYPMLTTKHDRSSSTESFQDGESDSQSNSSSSSGSGGGGDTPDRSAKLYNATLFCVKSRSRCETILLPEFVFVETAESLVTLSIYGLPKELALGVNASSVGVIYQRAPYTIGTIVWRYCFMVYSLLNLARFVYRRRLSRGIYEQNWIIFLQIALFFYLDPLFAVGIYERTGRNVYMFFEFHLPTYFAAILMAFIFTLVTSAMEWDAPPRAPALSQLQSSQASKSPTLKSANSPTSRTANSPAWRPANSPASRSAGRLSLTSPTSFSAAFEPLSSSAVAHLPQMSGSMSDGNQLAHANENDDTSNQRLSQTWVSTRETGSRSTAATVVDPVGPEFPSHSGNNFNSRVNPNRYGSVRGPPIWTRLVAVGFILLIVALDIWIGFLEDWNWETRNSQCKTNICSYILVGIYTLLLASVITCTVMIFWLRRNLGKKPYLESRPQQLTCLFFMFIFFTAFAYAVIQVVLLLSVYPNIANVVFYQPLLQLSPIMVCTFFTNHMTYVYMSTYRSKQVPIHPADSRWKRVVWPDAWHRWLQWHGGVLYMFNTESEERYFNLLQSAHHEHAEREKLARKKKKEKKKAELEKSDLDEPVKSEKTPLMKWFSGYPLRFSRVQPQREQASTNNKAATETVARDYGSAVDLDAPTKDEDSKQPHGTSTHSVLSYTNRKHGFRADLETRYNEYYRPFLSETGESQHGGVQHDASSMRSAAIHSDPTTPLPPPLPRQEENSGNQTDDAERKAQSYPAPLSAGAPKGDVPSRNPVSQKEKGSIAAWQNSVKSADRTDLSAADDDVYYSSTSGSFHVDDDDVSTHETSSGSDEDVKTNASTAGSTLGSLRSSVQRAKRSVRRMLKSAGGQFVVFPALLLDHLEDNVISKALRGFSMGDGQKRMPFFNLETAVDCFNLSWEAYAVDKSMGDQAIETGVDVNPILIPIALVSVAQKFARCCCCCCMSCCRAKATAGSENSTQQETLSKGTLPDATQGEHYRIRALSELPALLFGANGSSSSFAAQPDTEHIEVAAPTGPSMDTEQYGYRRVAVFEKSSVQVVITMMDVSLTPVHVNKHPRMMIAFRGTNSIANAKHDLNFKRVAWDDMNSRSRWRTAGAEAKVHSGFLEIWLSLKGEVSACIQKELQNNSETIYTIYTTGHSLGGALAVLCAYSMRQHLISLDYPLANVTVYTFGQPRIGNRTFQSAYNKAIPRTFRVVNESDAVSMFSIFAGHHVGIEVDIDRNGNFIAKPTYIERTFRPTKGKGFSVTNHLMTKYGASLNAMTQRSPCPVRCLQSYPLASARSSEDAVVVYHYRSALRARDGNQLHDDHPGEELDGDNESTYPKAVVNRHSHTHSAHIHTAPATPRGRHEENAGAGAACWGPDSTGGTVLRRQLEGGHAKARHAMRRNPKSYNGQNYISPETGKTMRHAASDIPFDACEEEDSIPPTQSSATEIGKNDPQEQVSELSGSPPSPSLQTKTRRWRSDADEDNA